MVDNLGFFVNIHKDRSLRFVYIFKYTLNLIKFLLQRLNKATLKARVSGD